MMGKKDLVEEASAAVPESSVVSVADPPSDLETETTSKRSKAKRSDKRGPKRQADRARYQLAKRGREVKGLSDEQVLALREEVFAQERGHLELGEEASLKFDLMAKFFEEFGNLGANARYKSTEVELTQVHSYTLARTQEYGVAWYKCLLCTTSKDKWADESHLRSSQHLKRVEEECYLNSILGPSLNGRRFGPDGVRGCRTLSRRAMKNYWGQHLENMVTFAQKKFQSGTAIHYKYSNNQPAAKVEGKDVTGVSLKVVSYLATQGKYHTQKNQLWDWWVLPDDVPEEEEGHGDDLGWWPVLQVELDPALGFEPVTVVVVIVCVYQLFDDVPPAWPFSVSASASSSSA